MTDFGAVRAYRAAGHLWQWPTGARRPLHLAACACWRGGVEAGPPAAGEHLAQLVVGASRRRWLGLGRLR